MKVKPIRHSAIYTVSVPDCLRILRTDACIYVTAENARQFLENLDKGEPFELSDGTPTTVADVPCLVTIELTAEEAARLKAEIEGQFGLSAAPTHAYSFLRFSGREKGKDARIRRLVVGRDEYVRRHGLTLGELPPVKGQPADALAAFLRLTQDGTVPPGSVLIVESLDRLTRQGFRSMLATLLAIMDAGVTVVSLNPEQVFSADDIFAQVMDLMSAGNDSANRSARMKAVHTQKKAAEGRNGTDGSR